MTEDLSVLTRGAPPPRARIDYGAHPDQHALLWQGAPAGAAERPLLLLLHGGFWRPAYDLAHMNPMAAALAGAGFSVVNVEYRRVPGDPEATLADLRLALATLPARIDAHNGRIVLVGFSAGGHLALLLAAGQVPLQAVLALAPVADLLQARDLRLSNDAVAEFLGPQIAVCAHWNPAASRAPAMPVRLLHGATDSIVPLELSRSYVRSHPAARLQVLPGVGHFGLIDPESVALAAVIDALRELSAR